MFPGIWDVWSLGYAGIFTAGEFDDWSFHGICDSIGYMSWSFVYLIHCACLIS